MQAKRTPFDDEWAWMAGLFEGEGYISFVYKRSVVVGIKMCDRDVLEALDALVPAPTGVRLIRGATSKHRALWAWTLAARDDVIWFLEGVRPWLLSRRSARADEALKRLEENRGIRASGDQVCIHGHVLAEVGLYVSPQGKRSCRGCKREATRRFKARNLEKVRARNAERMRELRARRSAARRASLESVSNAQ